MAQKSSGVSSKGSKQLGEIYLKTKITNIETGKSITLNLLVDTGATLTVVSKDKLKAIGIKPIDRTELTLADGRTIVRDVGVAKFTIKGRTAFGGVVFGEENDDNVLGITILEMMGWALDLKTGKLRRKRIRF